MGLASIAKISALYISQQNINISIILSCKGFLLPIYDYKWCGIALH